MEKFNDSSGEEEGYSFELRNFEPKFFAGPPPKEICLFKARFIRRISAVSNSIQLSAAEMRQLTQTSNFCRI